MFHSLDVAIKSWILTSVQAWRHQLSRQREAEQNKWGRGVRGPNLATRLEHWAEARAEESSMG